MSESTPTKTTTRKPAFIAYQVKDGAADQSYWTRLGVAFAHNDGKGFNLLLDAMPLGGQITLRAATSEKKE